MNVIITGRHFEVTDALRAYADDKIRKLDKLGTNIQEVSFVFSLEKYRHKVEVSLNANGQAIQAEAVTEEMYASIDEVLDKLGRQLKKLKEKSKEKHDVRRKGESTKARAAAAVAAEAVPAGERPERLIIRTSEFDSKPMTTEEAAMQLDLGNRDFVVFTNSANSMVNVVYRRKDGHVGLVEPSR